MIDGMKYKQAIQAVDQIFIRTGLVASGGIIRRAAKAVGMSFRQFRYLCDKNESYTAQVLAEIHGGTPLESISPAYQPSLDQVLETYYAHNLIPRHKYNNVGEKLGVVSK